MDSYFSLNNILSWSGGLWGILTVLFWSATYILISIAGFLDKQEKKVSMPYVSSVLNAGWEIAAIIFTRGNPGFIIWFLLDIFILHHGFSRASTVLNKLLYCASILFATGMLLFSFEKYDTVAFLFTVYLIDVIMGIEFIIKRAALSNKLKISIALTKLLGDLFAGLTFCCEYYFVVLFAIFSLICNCVYLVKCIKEQSQFSLNCKT